jgi:large subunit ribosomal protein L6
MSKMGMQPIAIDNVEVSVSGQTVSYKGPNRSGTYIIPDCLTVALEDGFLKVKLEDQSDKKEKALWGLHRALLNNSILGAREDFKKEVTIVGLGYKGQLEGDKIIFSLGYSHKINFQIPSDVKIEIDKVGQKLLVKSYSKHLVGFVADQICSLRRPEPYKGTGVYLTSKPPIRKAGKSKG